MALFNRTSSALRQNLACAALLLSILLSSVPQPASGQSVDAQLAGLDAKLQTLESEQIREMFTFIAGNVVFTLYHETGHMLVSELAIPVLGQEEDAVDNLATITMLSIDTDRWDLLLTNAVIGWFLIAEEDDEDHVFYGEHDLDQQRAYRMLCLMVGADEEAFGELARDLEMPEDRIETCGFDYDQTATSWEVATDPYIREEVKPGGMVTVQYEAAPVGLQSVALFLKTSELLERVAEDVDAVYDLPENITYRAASCGVENAFWEPRDHVITLCYELVGGFAEIFLDNLLEE